MIKPLFIWLPLDSFTIPIKLWKSVIVFLSFKELTREYLMKTSITHNKYLAPRFIEDIDPTLAIFAAQILSLKSYINFSSFEFFNHWCNSWASTLVTFVLTLLLAPDAFFGSSISFINCASGIRLPDCFKLAINQKNDNDVTIWWHGDIVNFFNVVIFLLSGSVTGPSFIAISSLVLEL